MELPEGEVKEMEKNLKEIMTEDFPNLRREMDINYQNPKHTIEIKLKMHIIT